MPGKKYINKKHMAVTLIMTVAFMMLLKFTWSTDTKLTLNAWEDVHQWRAEGKCSDCHLQHEYVKESAAYADVVTIPAAKTHSEQFRRFTHGKDKNSSSHNCQSCHKADSCQSCHAILPESHSSDFVKPTGQSAGSLRHVILAKSSPASCLACHTSFVDNCTACHAQEEIMAWQTEAARPLARWNEMLELK